MSDEIAKTAVVPAAPDEGAAVQAAPAPRPPAEDVIRDFFGVEEPTTRRIPDRKGKRS